MSSVAVSGDTLTLTLARSLAAGATLSYGLSTSPAAAWVKRAGDGAPAASLSALLVDP